jgi:putative transposase
MDAPVPLGNIPDAERDRALHRFRLIQPFLEDRVTLVQLAKDHGVALRTAERWIMRYRRFGLAGLCRKAYAGKGKRRQSQELIEAIEGLALQKPRLSCAAIHRKVVAIAQKLGEPVPSYASIYQSIRRMDPALLTMAHEGTKAYSESFDLVHRTEAETPNAIWQADHTELDILIKDDNGSPRKPWLTIILDDYSRAVAGYFLSLASPSAMQTSLALRQAIWRKTQAGWHICGIPQVLYTDHGCDFTSQHIEQVAADLKIQLVFSAVGRPRGRGKVERFFHSLAQVFLSRLPGYARSPEERNAVLTLPALAQELEKYLIDEYLVTPHSTTGIAPQARWDAGSFMPQMPESLEQLDLLLLTVPKARRVHPDGIHFMSLRYIDPTLAAYVGEQVVLRYDPRDMAEIRIFHQGRFLCRAICQELAGETVALREIVHARDRRRRELRQTIQDRRKTVDLLLEARQWTAAKEESLPASPESPSSSKLKRYLNE